MRLATLILCSLTVPALAQPGIGRIERQRTQQMLKSLKEEIRRNYYDPTFHGIDLDQHFAAAHVKLDEAVSLSHGMGIIAQALLDFDDSHLFFLPPSRTSRVQYGWLTQMVGDECYIVAVQPGSDAAQKGLKPGTRVLAVEGRKPTRQTLWKMKYHYYTLRPRPVLRVAVQPPGGNAHELDLAAKVTQGKRVLDLTDADSLDFDELIREMDREVHVSRHRIVRLGSLAIWKLPTFGFAPDSIDRTATDVFEGADRLILDLRGNPGGAVRTLERLTSRFFDRDVKIAELHGRKAFKPLTAKKQDRPFAGKVVALVDSASASAAELFSRVLQIEKRGVVIGDRSAGAVMQAYGYSGQMGAERMVFFGASITNADVIMTDGKSLEKGGVTPDETVVPTADDMAAGHDPVLARAAAILGVPLTPAAAGAMFPVDWR